MKIKTEDIRKTPYMLPERFEWCTLDPHNDEDISAIHEFMKNHYFENPGNLLRMYYSKNFLKWILTLPNESKDWLVGVKVEKSKLLVGMINGFSSNISIKGKMMKMGVVGFLCVHTKLRKKRLTPVLIKELKRRIALNNIHQAAYNVYKFLPTPICVAKWWQRIINFKKMHEVFPTAEAMRNLISSDPKSSLKVLEKACKLPNVNIKGFRKMTNDDVNEINKLLNNYLQKYTIRLNFTEEMGRHMFIPREGVIESYVVEDRGITDFISFFTISYRMSGTGLEYKVIYYI